MHLVSSRASILIPPKWRLIARDAFNGTLLWKRKIELWHPHLWQVLVGRFGSVAAVVEPVGIHVRGKLALDFARVQVAAGHGARVGTLSHGTIPHLRTYDGTKATEEILCLDSVLILSVAGEGQPLRSEHWICHHWVRGACHYGIMPCNGLIYAPQHPCACYIEAKLYGFTAVAPPSPTMQPRRNVPDAERLTRGPAYGARLASRVSNRKSDDWPNSFSSTMSPKAQLRILELRHQVELLYGRLAILAYGKARAKAVNRAIQAADNWNLCEFKTVRICG